ncbi:hypothetical protein JHK85_023479 [Glycine max]|nr:hypothetical protein JHK85_023479 [Glycine max]
MTPSCKRAARVVMLALQCLPGTSQRANAQPACVGAEAAERGPWPLQLQWLAFVVLQEFLNRSKESDIPGQKVPDVRLVDLKDMIEELKSGNEEGRVLQELLNRTKESDSTGHKIPDLRPADFKDMVEDSKSGNEEGQVLQEFLNRTNKSDIPEHKIPNLQLVDLKDMIEDLKSGNEEGQACWRKMDCYENSPGSSGYSTGSILICQSASDNLEHSLHQDIGTEMKSKQLEDEKGVKVVMPTANVDQDMVPCCMEQINNDGIVSTSSRLEFSSPLQVTPLFRSLAAGIPSPQFSESKWYSVMFLQDLSQLAVGLSECRKELLKENTRNGISIHQPKCQLITTATLQKSPTT